MEWARRWGKREQVSTATAPPENRMQVIFSADQAAAALLTFGEEDLVEAARQLDDDTLRGLWALTGRYWLSADRLPLNSRVAADKVIALTCIEHFEWRLRPLVRERRRPRSQMPDDLQLAKGVPPDTRV